MGVLTSVTVVALMSFSLLSLTFSCVKVDETFGHQNKGEDVVNAVVSRIRQARISPQSHTFLRRLAFVETKDGNDDATFRAGYHGGIWQVDNSAFQATKDVSSNPALREMHQNILQEFSIYWPSVQWTLLRRPIYSGIAAQLLLFNINQEIPLASDIAGQAEFWKTHYNSAGSVQTFIEDVTAQETIQDGECRKAIDLIFVLDASGSITANNFNLIRNLVDNIIQNLDIGPDASRVGVILYSRNATVQFSLNTYQTKSALLNAVANIPYTGGGTYTSLAINACIEQFNTTFGARPRSSGIPRVAIVLTDGRSQNSTATIEAAKRAHEAKILTYAIGIGNGVYLDEVKAIASDPDSQYLHLIPAFSVKNINALRDTLNEEACTAPALPEIGQAITGTLKQNQTIFVQTTLPKEGMTFRLDANVGSLALFCTNKIPMPNQALYDFTISNSTTKCPSREVYVNESTFGLNSTSRSKRQVTDFNDIIVYVSIRGQGVSNQFNFSTTLGDTTTPDPSSSSTAVIIGVVAAGVIIIALLVVAIVGAVVAVKKWLGKKADK